MSAPAFVAPEIADNFLQALAVIPLSHLVAPQHNSPAKDKEQARKHVRDYSFSQGIFLVAKSTNECSI